MMETIRIRQQGYAMREPHDTFFSRYGLLCPEAKNLTELVDQLSSMLSVGSKQWQIGNTKIFLRREFSELLEQLARSRVRASARTIQHAYREYKMKASVIRVQSFRRTLVASRVYAQQRAAVVSMQKVARGRLGRRRHRELKEQGGLTHAAAIVMQRICRRLIACVRVDARRKQVEEQDRIRGLESMVEQLSLAEDEMGTAQREAAEARARAEQLEKEKEALVASQANVQGTLRALQARLCGESKGEGGGADGGADGAEGEGEVGKGGTAIEISVTFDLDFEKTMEGDDEGGARSAFEAALLEDMASAMGVTVGDLTITSLRAGSVVADIVCSATVDEGTLEGLSTGATAVSFDALSKVVPGGTDLKVKGLSMKEVSSLHGGGGGGGVEAVISAVVADVELVVEKQAGALARLEEAKAALEAELVAVKAAALEEQTTLQTELETTKKTGDEAASKCETTEEALVEAKAQVAALQARVAEAEAAAKRAKKAAKAGGGEEGGMLDPFAAMQAEADDEELDDLKDRVEELEATKTVMSSKIEKERAAGDKKVEAARLAEQKEQRVKEDLTAARIRTLWNLFPGHEAAAGGGGGGGGRQVEGGRAAGRARG
jgi:myosin heavy subunit